MRVPSTNQTAKARQSVGAFLKVSINLFLFENLRGALGEPHLVTVDIFLKGALRGLMYHTPEHPTN